jgi:hypothetical protein
MGSGSIAADHLVYRKDFMTSKSKKREIIQNKYLYTGGNYAQRWARSVQI